MPTIQLPKNFLDNLEYDPPKMTTTTAPLKPAEGQSDTTFMLVFAKSDLNAAAYHLVESMKSPLGANAIVTLLVQESIAEDFVSKVQSKLPANLEADVHQHASYAQVVDSVGTVRTAAHSLIFDVTHEQLGSTATGLITVHIFRTIKEAIALCSKETVQFVNATIWIENHAAAYEVVASTALKCQNYFINCRQTELSAALSEHITKKSSYVSLEKGYHYETLPVGGTQKTVVFPVGTIFAN